MDCHIMHCVVQHDSLTDGKGLRMHTYYYMRAWPQPYDRWLDHMIQTLVDGAGGGHAGLTDGFDHIETAGYQSTGPRAAPLSMYS